MFFFIFSTTRQETEGPTVTIDCPVCGLSGPADSREIAEKASLFFLPYLRVRTTQLTCQNCGETFCLSIPVDELNAIGADSLNQMLREHSSSLVRTAVALASLASAFVPVAGLIVALITLPSIWKIPSWQRIVSILALILSFFSTVFYWTFFSAR